MATIVIKAGDKVNVKGSNQVVSSVAPSLNATTKKNLAAISLPATTVSVNEDTLVLSEITASGKATYVAG